MSEQTLSAEEKRELLRERRQAKMAKGKASERLNNILTQGSSVKSAPVVSKLDEPKAAVKSENSPISVVDDKEDPEIQDIDTIVNKDSTPAEVDIDKILQDMLGGANPNASADKNGGADDMFRQMMSDMMNQDLSAGDGGDDVFKKMMGNLMNQGTTFSEGANVNENSEEVQYQKDLAAYNAYQQDLWKYRLLIVRIIVTVTNFFYHFYTLDDSFNASSYSYIRGFQPTSPVNSFIAFFFTAEIAILASYYMMSIKNGTFKAAHDNGLISKGISMASMFLPQLEQIKPIIIRFLGYMELIKIFVGDISIVVILFGLFSFLR